MPLSGEAIRLMNYIDDVAVTLRRVLATVPTLSAEERARVAEHLQQTSPSADDVMQALTGKSEADAPPAVLTSMPGDAASVQPKPTAVE